MTLTEYQRLKERVERLQRDADRASGALEQSLRQLREEFGCGSIEQAELKLKKLKRRLVELEQEYETAAAEFERQYKGRLNDGS